MVNDVLDEDLLEMELSRNSFLNIGDLGFTLNYQATDNLMLRTTYSSNMFGDVENLVNETDKQLYADSAYRSEKIEKYLKEKKCQSHIHEKGYRANPLTKQQKELNTIKSKIRARVEHIFGFMTNSMHNALHMQCIGKERIEAAIGFLNLTYNLFRYEQLVRLQKVKIV